MAKKLISVAPQRARLIMDTDSFKQQLEEQIEKGRELIEIQVAKKMSYGQPTYGHNSHNAYDSLASRQYEAEQYEPFRQKFIKWTEYNEQLLKQAFDMPNNEYQATFYHKGNRQVLFGNEDVMKVHREELQEKISFLESLIDQLPLLPTVGNSVELQESRVVDSKKVFIVHGHDKTIRTEVELFVKNLGFEPIVLFKQTNQGSTIINKLERNTKDACFAIVLYTSCDEGRAVGDSELKPRARQNVVFEHGMMWGLLGRERVVALVEEGVEIPGDLSGVVYISLNDSSWQLAVAKEMKAAQLDVDLNKLI